MGQKPHIKERDEVLQRSRRVRVARKDPSVVLFKRTNVGASVFNLRRYHYMSRKDGKPVGLASLKTDPFTAPWQEQA